MFSNASEKTLDKVYDWITYTYYSPYPDWAERDYGPERRRDRLYAIHALNDMRALYAGVGNNGWWDEERVLGTMSFSHLPVHRRSRSPFPSRPTGFS